MSTRFLRLDKVFEFFEFLPHQPRALTWHTVTLSLTLSVLTMLVMAQVHASDSNSQADTNRSLYEIPKREDHHTFLEQQIFRGESSSALASLEAEITQIEAVRHRYHEDLVVPLILSGDALMVQGETAKALDKYARARHVTRVSHGLFAKDQLPVVYREADALRKVGDIRGSAQREEYAYEVARRAYGEFTPNNLAPLYRLANFYMSSYNFLPARTLYNHALAVLEDHRLGESPKAIPALQGIATSHRLARFPPVYIHTTEDNARFAGASQGLTTRDLENQHTAFNNFPAGERALQRIVAIHQQADPVDSEEVAQAMTALADWHLLFGRSQAASVLYKHIVQEIDQPPTGDDPQNGPGNASVGPEETPPNETSESTSETSSTDASDWASDRFSRPTMIHFPVPSDPSVPKNASPGSGERGYVTLTFDVGPTGRVRRLKTADAYPSKLMEFRVRRSMRQAVFRPKIEAGVPVLATNQSYTHHFTFYPTATGGTQPSPQDKDPGEEPSADKEPSAGREPSAGKEPSADIDSPENLDTAPTEIEPDVSGAF